MEKMNEQTILAAYGGGVRDFQGLSLRGFDFHRCDLSEADFRGSDLGGANLREARLSLVRLEEANLQRALMEYSFCSRAILRKADLSEANLSYAFLGEADLNRAYLRSAILDNSSLSGANLTGANLSNADLSYVKAPRAIFFAANLKGITVNWYDPTLVSEVLIREAADNFVKQALALLVRRMVNWCWSDWLSDTAPSGVDQASWQTIVLNNRDWALSAMRRWVKPGDNFPCP